MKKFKCALISDNHLGYTKNTFRILEIFFEKLAKENIDILFIAGDEISHNQDQFERFYKLVRKFLPDIKIYSTKGNHSLWHKNGTLPSMPWDSDPFISVDYNFFYRTRGRLPSYKQPMSYGRMKIAHDEVYKKYNIIHLDGTSHELTENIVVMGFDGWYNEVNLAKLGTNDYRYMPEMIESAPSHVYLRNKAEKDLEKLLDTPTEGKTVIMMTHFPPFSDRGDEVWNANPRFMNFITEKCDYLFVGHSHRQCDFVENGCRVINAGIDETVLHLKGRYDKPRYVVFELEG